MSLAGGIALFFRTKRYSLRMSALRFFAIFLRPVSVRESLHLLGAKVSRERKWMQFKHGRTDCRSNFGIVPPFGVGLYFARAANPVSGRRLFCSIENRKSRELCSDLLCMRTGQSDRSSRSGSMALRARARRIEVRARKARLIRWKQELTVGLRNLKVAELIEDQKTGQPPDLMCVIGDQPGLRVWLAHQVRQRWGSSKSTLVFQFRVVLRTNFPSGPSRLRDLAHNMVKD